MSTLWRGVVPAFRRYSCDGKEAPRRVSTRYKADQGLLSTHGEIHPDRWHARRIACVRRCCGDPSQYAHARQEGLTRHRGSFPANTSSRAQALRSRPSRDLREGSGKHAGFLHPGLRDTRHRHDRARCPTVQGERSHCAA